MIPDQVSIWNELAPIPPLLSCNSVFERTVFTWLRNESEVIRTSSRSGSKFSFQCEILSRNHINGDQISFRYETGSRPGQRTRSLVFLWFSAALLRALYLVRPRSVWVRSETVSCKHGTKGCFSFQIELDPVSCKHTLWFRDRISHWIESFDSEREPGANSIRNGFTFVLDSCKHCALKCRITKRAIRYHVNTP